MSQSRLSQILSNLDTELGTTGNEKPVSNLSIADAAPLIEKEAEKQAKKVRDTEDGDAIVAMVKRWIESSRNARRDEERKWSKNLDMYQGRQFTVWNDQTRSMQEQAALPYEPRIMANIIEPTCRTEMAKTASARPTAYVVPASNDQSDAMAAFAGEQVWEWHQRTENFQSEVFDPANLWRTVTGNAFIKVYLDGGLEDTAATEAAQKEYENALAQSAGQIDPNVGMAPPPPPPPGRVMGKIQGRPVTPFHLLVPDLTAISLQRQPYVIHQYTMPKTKAALHYKDALPDDWAPGSVAQDTIIQLSHIGVKQPQNASGKGDVIVYEVYVKPGYTPQLPNGGYIVLLGDTLVQLKTDGLPYAHGDYPFHHLYGIDTGRFYRKSTVESITPMQDQLNRSLSQMVKHRNLMLKPQMFYDEGSLEPQKIRSVAGAYIPVRLGFNRPTPVPMQEIPQSFGMLLDRMSNIRDDISGQHQVSRAVSPGADSAASLVSLLKETDDDMLTTVMNGIHTAIQGYARQMLALAVQFWSEPRLVKVVGGESAGDAKSLAGADLKNGTDLWFDDDSFLPQSRTAKNAIITDWMTKGFVPVDVGLEALNQGTLGKAWQQMNLDKSQARRENIAMRDLDPGQIQEFNGMQAQLAAQQPVGAPGVPGTLDGPPAAPPAPPLLFPINDWDNDLVHYREHSAYMKGQEWASLDPEHQQVFIQHLNAHGARAGIMPGSGGQPSMMPMPGAAGTPTQEQMPMDAGAGTMGAPEAAPVA